MPNNKTKTILIVEDDPDISFVLSTWLESENYFAYFAENGAIALELIKQNGIPHLILLDMMMPIMNGWEFAKELELRYGKPCPIIVMTAAENAQGRAYDIGAADWISKPFLLDHVLELIKKHENI